LIVTENAKYALRVANPRAANRPAGGWPFGNPIYRGERKTPFLKFVLLGTWDLFLCCGPYFFEKIRKERQD
jgi:hypothetical protein